VPTEEAAFQPDTCSRDDGGDDEYDEYGGRCDPGNY
jgi:hypothetical protein